MGSGRHGKGKFRLAPVSEPPMKKVLEGALKEFRQRWKKGSTSGTMVRESQRKVSGMSSGLRVILQTVLTLVLPLVLACSHPLSLPSMWGIPPQEASGTPLSIQVVLLADNQLHYLYGDPVWLRSGFTDRLVPVTIRPVQLDFYAPYLLRWIIANYADKRPLIHLGDGLNIACTVEFEAFKKIMDRSGRGWVMAPGNHDGYYFGNGHFAWSEWERACKTADGTGRPLTKDRFIEEYLKALAEQSGGQAQFGFTLPGSLGLGSWESTATDASFLRSVAWKIDRDSPWRSYLVQRLNLTLPGRPISPQKARPQVNVILLDTSQYYFRPRLVPFLWVRNSGLTGDLLDDQIQVIDDMLARRESGQVTILMGHHPYHALTVGAQRALDRWQRDGAIQLYVSAHTHTAQYYVRQSNNTTWLELNLGSSTDWTPEFRTLSVSTAEGYNGQVAFRMVRNQVHQLWEAAQIPDCNAAWEVNTQREDFYVSYAKLITPDPARTQITLMNTLLRSYEWLLKFVKSSPSNTVWPDGTGRDDAVLKRIQDALLDSVPLDQKLALLRQLQSFDDGRKVDDEKLRDQFRLCQAMWASKYDLVGARAPNVDDAYLLIPRSR